MAPAPGADPAQLREFLLGPVLRVALRQRGWLLVHGRVLAVAERRMVCLDATGASVVALSAGADDVEALEGCANVPTVVDAIYVIDACASARLERLAPLDARTALLQHVSGGTMARTGRLVQNVVTAVPFYRVQGPPFI